MLHVLSDISRLLPAETAAELSWYNVPLEQLHGLLPFWPHDELLRVAKNLRDKGILILDSQSLPRAHSLRFAMNNRTAPAARQPQTPSPARISNKGSAQRQYIGANLLAENWQPNEDLLQLLALNHNIPREFALAQIEDFVLYWHERQQVSHSWPSKFRQHVIREWRHQQNRQSHAEKNREISGRWQPSIEAMEILQRTGIDPGFIEDTIPEFVLYWSERGVASDTWNSKFIAHIRRQWARFTATIKGDYEPRIIPTDWQPSEDAFDILRLANIDLDFARQLVPEFVLFWRDTQEAHRSWNSKFLQHTKYQWATRHHLGPTYAGQPIADRSAQATTKGPFERLTDRSWAEGIVEEI